MKKYIVIIGLLMCSSCLYSQWVSSYWGNNPGDEPVLNSIGMAVASDKDGNSYVTGYTYNNSTNFDIILIKYNIDGDTVFTRIYNGNSNGEDKAFGIVIDEDGNIYIIGQTEAAGRGLELVLIKYDRLGRLEWDETYGATNANKDDLGRAITLDNSNNIYVTGYVTRSNDSKNIVVIKYGRNGSRLWTKTVEGEGGIDSEGLGIAVDDDNYIYVTGYTTSLSSAVNTDIITLKYSSSGQLKWNATFNGQTSEEDKAFGITLDDADNVYITGYTTIDTSVLNTSAVIIKYNKTGEEKWVKTYESGVPGSLDKAWGIVVDDDDIYITGQAAGMGTDLNYFTRKFNKNGATIWTSTYDGPGHGVDYANAITVLKNGKIAVTGASWGINNNFDYATLVLKKQNGLIQSAYRFDLGPNSNDIAEDISSSENRIYVTGYSELHHNSPVGNPTSISTLEYLGGDNEDVPSTNIPAKFNLYQNFPNPFNPSTTIKFDISDRSQVKLVVYDMLGKVVDVIVDQQLDAGNYSITYKNNNLSSGIYFYQLTAGNYSDVKRMSLIK